MSVGKVMTAWIQEGVDLYGNRISKYIKFSPLIVPDIKNAKSLPKEMVKESEGKEILKQIFPSDYMILMDEKGKDLTSREFSDWIVKQMNSGKKRLVLVIGGPYGFSQAVYDRCDAKIALSKMTFTHEMAKLILTEQIYRAFTIMKGEPYHHD